MSERVPLSRVPVGGRCTVVAVGDDVRAELEREGLLPGTEVVVTARTPLGGPVIVDLGRARVALAAAVAAAVLTGPVRRASQP